MSDGMNEAYKGMSKAKRIEEMHCVLMKENEEYKELCDNIQRLNDKIKILTKIRDEYQETATQIFKGHNKN